MLIRLLCLLAICAVSISNSFAAFPLSFPAASSVNLALDGNPASGYGITGYRNATLGQPNTGHLVSGVIQNAPDPAVPLANKFYADYYITGIDNSPFTKPAGGTAAAVATTPSNMTNLAAYVSSNSLSYSDITFHFGQNVAANVQESWNLGADTQGSEWTGSMASPIENRIYAANSAQASTYLAYQGSAIVNFAYSDLYEIIDYGPTSGGGDDTIQAYSDPVPATAVLGLAGDAQGLANAFISDVNANGGFVQLSFDTIQAATYTGTPESYSGTDYIVANYEFSGSIMVVPEPGRYAALMSAAALALCLVRRRTF